MEEMKLEAGMSCVLPSPPDPMLKSAPLARQCSRRTVSAALQGPRPRVIVISGPTAVGKSSAAVEIAKRLNGEIISADSVQVYKGLDVGSAKTPHEDRQGIPHHLVDIVEPQEDYSVGEYYRRSREATEIVLSKGKVPIVVGGTGMYLRWYLYGPAVAPKSTPEIRALAEEEIAKANGDWDKAVALLCEAGDLTASRLHRNDWYRLCRRFEILKASGLPVNSFGLSYTGTEEDSLKADSLDYDFLCFCLHNTRETLYRFIDERCEEMLIGDMGLLKESSWLLDSGIMSNSSPASRAIGYRQAMEYLMECRMANGVSSSEQFLSFLASFQKVSRNFAKRQLTWFRQERLYHWIDASQKQEAIIDFIVKAYTEPTILNGEEANQILVSKEDTTDKRNKLKVYQTVNKHFTGEEACCDVLEWIRDTQTGKL